MTHHLPQLFFRIVLFVATLVLVSCGGGESNAPDTTAPIIISITPFEDQVDVTTDSTIIVEFSEEMDDTTFDSKNFHLIAGGDEVPGSIQLNRGTAIFIPANPLFLNTDYTFTVTTGIKDLAGNALAVDKIWNFSTTMPPTVISESPTGFDIVRNTSVSVAFSEAMNDVTIDSTTFQVKTGGKDVPGTIQSSGNTYTFTPNSFLRSGTTYNVTITMGVTDLAGNALTSQKDWYFTTGSRIGITVSWDPNREMAVNTTGGGYKVYYSTTRSFNIPDAEATEVDVPYVSGLTAPTSTSLKLLSDADYYFRVVAYSALNPPGGGWGSTSAPSDEAFVKVP